MVINCIGQNGQKSAPATIAETGGERIPLTTRPFRLENAAVGGLDMSHFKRFFILVAALIALLDLAAWAQTQTPAQNPLPPPVDRTRSKEAQKKVAATESDVKKAQQAL